MKALWLSIFFFFIFLSPKSQSAGDFRTVASGSWNTSSVWERFDGMLWQSTLVSPTETDGIITIRNLHVIDANLSITADQVIIDAGGSLTVSATVTIADGTGDDLTCNGTLTLLSTFAGTGTTIINGNMNWTLGTLSTNLIISSTGILNISTGSTKAINGILTNNGTINWAAGNLNFNNGTLTNNGTIINSFDGTLSDFSGANIFNNNGTFTKSAGASITYIAVPSVHTGSLNINIGTLSNTGTMNLNTGTLINGNGTFSMGGTISINTAVSTPSTLTITKSSGTTTGSGSFTINGNINWTGGTFGSSITIAAGAVLTASSGTKTLAGTLTNNGTINWSGGTVNFSNAIVNNNNIINNSFDGQFSNFSGTNSFNSTGTFNKTGGATNTTIGVPTTNSGTFNINSGTILKSTTPFTNSGTINISTGTTFSNTATINLNTGSLINGAGTLILDGTVNVNTALSTPSTLTVSKPNGGTSTGTGVFTVTGLMTWTGGTIGSPFTIAAGATLTISSINKALNSTLINDGLLNWTGGGINFNNGTLTNNGTIDNSFDGTLSNVSGVNAFNNSGTFSKSAGVGTSTIALPFSNNGLLNIGTGTLANNATMDLNNGTSLTGSGTLQLANTVNINAAINSPASLTITKSNGTSSGAGLFTVNGVMNWTGGTVGSPFLVSSAGSLNLFNPGTKTLTSIITNEGSTMWSAGTFTFTNGTFNNNGTFNSSFNGTINTSAGTNAINNNGIFIKSVGTGTTTIGIPTINTGVFRGIGTINFTAAFTNNGAIEPGISEGILTITSSVSPVLTSASSLNIELLDGSGAGSGHDQLIRNSNLVLNGTLNATETGTVPAGSYTIISLTAGSITGSFSSMNIPPGYTLNVGSATVVLTKAAILPLKLLKFEGRNINNKIDLQWQTTSEENFSHFDIEKSVNGTDYYSIGKKSGQNSVAVIKNYSFSDLQPNGINYYRLKMVDVDGRFEYSKVLKLSISRNSGDLKLYPNPSKGKLFITLSDQWLGSDLAIYNTVGQMVLNKMVINSIIEIDLAQPTGTYWVIITKNNKSLMQQIILRTK